jgi:tRNA uridine 5-carboxymethylaminomethyl modification enzyme
LAARRIPAGLDYQLVPHLRAEAREKLARVSPTDLAQAARISGITPADVSVLLVHLEKGFTFRGVRENDGEDRQGVADGRAV